MTLKPIQTTAILLLIISNGAFAQQRDKRRPGVQAVRVQQNVRPAFKVEPIVHRLEARRGQTLRFAFAMESLEKETTLQIRGVGLRQQENGVIMPDEDAPAPEFLRILTPPSVKIEKNERAEIRGQLTVPRTDSTFMSFGILVKDLGRVLPQSQAPGQPKQAGIGIRFVTQYLLRVDVTVVGARGERLNELKLESGDLVEQDGRSLAQVFVINPTESTFEFELQARLHNPEALSRNEAFKLILPVRRGRLPPERFVARILPGARIRLEDFLPQAVFPGEYSLDCAIVRHRRRIVESQFPIVVEPGDFPAQDATIIRVARDVTISPTRVELSLQRGGSRFKSVLVANNSEQNVKFRLAAQPFGDQQASWLKVRPAEFDVAPRSSRKVLVSMGPNRGLSDHQYAWMEVEAIPEVGESIGKHRIPVALIARNENGPEIAATKMQWDDSGNRPAFLVPVTNSGSRHLPLNAEMTLEDEFGRGVTLQAGYGRWLLPGATDRLRFSFKKVPPPGDYRVTATIDLGEDRKPLVLNDTFRLSNRVAAEPSLDATVD